MDDLSDLYRSRLFDRQYPIDEAAAQVDMAPEQGKQQGFGEIKPIPRNAVEDIIGKLGTALEHAGVPLDQIGLDIPVLGRITAKDLLLGDSAEFLNNLADGFYPVSGSGETMRLNDGAWGALDTAAIPGAVAGAVKFGVKGAKAIGSKVASSASEWISKFGGDVKTAIEAAKSADAPQDVIREMMTVFHGSPHTFDKFDMGKLGTGEGAQAYGHGLYFADNKAVADWYRTRLGSADPADVGKAIDTIASKEGISKDKVIENWGYSNERDYVTLASEKYGFTPSKKGRMYTVQIPKDSEFVMWDKLVDDQPKLKDVLENKLGMDVDGKTAGQVIKRFEHDGHGDPSELSRVLKENGFAGTKYLDGNSRTPIKAVSYDGDITDTQKEALSLFNQIGISRRWEIEPDKLLKQLIDNREWAVKELESGNKYIDKNARKELEALKSLDPGKIKLPLDYNYVIFDDSVPKIVRMESRIAAASGAGGASVMASKEDKGKDK